MQTAWDYTKLAASYIKRPDYSPDVIEHLLGEMKSVEIVCDVGAGVGHLTRLLRSKNLKVIAVEPNDAMRELGYKRTDSEVEWVEGLGEETGLETGRFDLVTFGSSFNVTNQQGALRESARILRSGGYFACMWNHRDLSDPIQAGIEKIIHTRLPEYDYGTRRKEQSSVIDSCELFDKSRYFEGHVVHRQRVDDVIEAWRSHATLARQAGGEFPSILLEVENYLRDKNVLSIDVPYVTRMWYARKK